MHTAYIPNPTVVHPTFGSVVSYELGAKRKELDIPSFVSIGGPSMGPGFMGMMHSPFQVDSNGDIIGYASDSGGTSVAVVWTPAPEPSSIALLAIGAIGLAAMARRYRRT